MTAHTADDQAETVLFRIARGSGPRGLGGIRPGRSPSLVRPLLPFRRRDVEEYAAARGVPLREDPSNRDPRWTRNRLRHEILPALEAAVPGAAAALVSLSGTSRLESAALDALLDLRIETLAQGTAPGPGLSFARRDLATLPDPVLTVLLRRAAARLGGRPGRAATADLLRFVRESPAGREVTLAGGVTVAHAGGSVHFRPAGAERAAAGEAGPPRGEAAAAARRLHGGRHPPPRPGAGPRNRRRLQRRRRCAGARHAEGFVHLRRRPGPGDSDTHPGRLPRGRELRRADHEQRRGEALLQPQNADRRAQRDPGRGHHRQRQHPAQGGPRCCWEGTPRASRSARSCTSV